MSGVIYTGKLKGGPPVAAKFRFVTVKPDTDLIAVILPPGEDPVPYISREGETMTPPTPATHLVVVRPTAIFKRVGNFRLYKGRMRATFKFHEMKDRTFTSEKPKETP